MLGLIAGVIVIYLCLVGIVGAFAERNVVTNVFTLGRVMLAIPPLIVGYLAAGRLQHRSIAGRLVAGGLAGAVGGAMLGVFLLFASAVDIRDMFVRVSQDLLDFIAFGQDPAIGAILNVVFGAACGAVAAGVRTAPQRWRRPVIALPSPPPPSPNPAETSWR